ncbi:MAG: glycoside hydrolase/phage tail family protein, partial [Candidatus Puniceispirillum sp.]
DFSVSQDAVGQNGPADEWGYNRIILHYAALCARAGGVSAFCIGSEMRGLSVVRDQSDGFVAVAHLQDLAQQVRQLLGPEVKLGYAADWSEYFGYRPAEADGDMIFHLDPLWSSSDIDFIGIDNYMPLSDWRDGIAHKDAAWGSLYDLAYLTSNIAGGEGYDWYYPSSEARNVQARKPIEDTAYDQAWIWRYKDLKNWWSQKHYNRINGLRSTEPTQWQPKSKPIWFTELGVAAVDKATNQPNVFFDPKSSESALPYFSVGQRDEYIQMQYLRAMHLYWVKPEHNPESDVYAGRMLDCSRMFVWTWDARPFPYFPAAEDLWADGENYARGHWITGRVSGVSLAAGVAEICERSGLFDYDVSDLHGYVRGYKTNGEESARGLLQPLALHFGFDAVEQQGVVRFLQRGAGVERPLDLASLVDSKELEAPIEWRRDGVTERVGRLQQSFALAEGVYDVVSEEVQLASDSDLSVSQIETGLVLTRAEARQAMQRWLVEARLAKDTIRFALPPSQRQIGAGDRVRVKAAGRSDSYRIDRVELGSFQTLTAVRSDAKLYQPQPYQADRLRLDRFVPPLPVFATFLDLPSLSGDEQPQAPYVAVSAQPWPGRVAVYASDSLDDYALAQVITRQSYIGRLCSPLPAGPLGLIDMGTQLLVEMPNLQLSSIKLQAFLAGRNKMAIGDGSAGNWEIVQFQFAALRERGVYQLSGLLRGLHGSDGFMPAEWPSGSLLVTLDPAPPQISALPIKRGIERHFRIGPAAKP